MKNENLAIYDAARTVPENAQRKITGGKLNGKTDINPMWRIKKLTELYGPCGTGWYVDIVEKWLDNAANGEITANIKILLYVKTPDGWSHGVVGIGGNQLVQTEKGKLVTNDEAYKMALTDAISVACKMLGFGADIYWQQDRTKYTTETAREKSLPEPIAPPEDIEIPPELDYIVNEPTAQDIEELKAIGGTIEGIAKKKNIALEAVTHDMVQAAIAKAKRIMAKGNANG